MHCQGLHLVADVCLEAVQVFVESIQSIPMEDQEEWIWDLLVYESKCPRDSQTV